MTSFLFECVNGPEGSGCRVVAQDLDRAKQILHVYLVSSNDPFNYMLRPHHVEKNFRLVDGVERETDINAKLEKIGLGWVLELSGV